MLKIKRSNPIKKFVRIVSITGISIIALLLLIYLLLWLPPVQQKIKDIALAEIMKKTHNQMSIGNLSFRPFNRLQLEDVYVEDLKGDTLLFAANLSASFNLFRLMKQQLLIQSVDIADFVVRVNKDSVDADFNFQFFIDAFESDKQDTTSSQMIIQINDISLKNGRLRYDILSEPAAEEGVFDSNHIHLSNFQLELDLTSIDLKHLNGTIENLAFTECSGFEMNQLRAKITSKNKKISLKDFRIQLPHSEVTVSEAWVDYTAFSIEDAFKKGFYSLLLGNNHIAPEDVKMFYPPLSVLSDEFIFKGSLNGTFPGVNLASLSVDYGNHIGLNIRASMENYLKWKDSPFQLVLEHLSADAYGIRQILDVIAGEEKIKLPVNAGAISLTGSLTGEVSDLTLQLDAKTDRGSLQLNGTGGYSVDSRIARFDARLNTDHFDLQTLLQDSLWGYASLQLDVQGLIGTTKSTNVSGTATVSRCDFNTYSYRDIQAVATYSGDSLRLRIDSEDANVPLKIRGMANFGNRANEIKLYARLDSVYLDSLNLLPNYKDARLSTSIHLDMKGLDIERMNLNLAVDSFLLHTDKGSFKESKFRLNYQAADSSSKQLAISSHILNAKANGRFTYTGIKESLIEAFPVLFPEAKPQPKKKDAFADNLTFRIAVNNANSFSNLLELPKEIPDSALFIGKYSNDGEILKLSASAFTQFMEADTLQLSLSLSNKENKLAAIFNVDNKSENYNLDGSLDAEIEFVPIPGKAVPDINISLNPTIFVLNETSFDFHPAQIEIRDNRYIIHDLLLDHDHNTDEYVQVDGVVSGLPEDSLTIRVSHLQLETLFSAAKTNIPLSGEANGEIVGKQLLSMPRIMSRGFAVNTIIYAGNAMGDLNVRSIWSSERKGLALRATLTHENRPPSLISGFFLPEKDSLSMTATIRGIELKWLNTFTQGTLYGLDGSLNADIQVGGKTQNPQINGIAYFDNAQVGITALNTLYRINDSIYLSPDLIELKRFTINDESNQTVRASGKITHHLFSDFNPNISFSLSNFLVINNEHQTDSLFYGKLRINGLLNLKQNNKNWVLSGDVVHSNDSKVMVNIPSSASTAERYNSITFINTEKTKIAGSPKKTKSNSEKLSFPLKINVDLWLDPSLTVGAVFNPLTKDAAQVKGSGSLNFAYDMNNSAIALSGSYVIESGKATLSLVNLTRKTFAVQEGGKLTFNGDPMATTFDLTALYNLRADLTVLDPNFQNIGVSSSKIPVSCSLTAIGSIDKMELKYAVLLPNEQEEIQRKVNSLLYTDDLMIKEIAYLLAIGSFMPINSDDNQASNSIWTSLASSSITSQLNNLLSGVLNENWSIGTDLHTSDTDFNNVDMDVNISTRLFNDRLMLNSTLGYHNDPSQAENFTGDFDIEYKLNPSGNVLLKVYNVTNNQYYEKAKTTQGVGVVYKRKARTFMKLFDTFKNKKKQGNESNQE